MLLWRKSPQPQTHHSLSSNSKSDSGNKIQQNSPEPGEVANIYDRAKMDRIHAYNLASILAQVGIEGESIQHLQEGHSDKHTTPTSTLVLAKTLNSVAYPVGAVIVLQDPAAAATVCMRLHHFSTILAFGWPCAAVSAGRLASCSAS